MHLPVTPPVLPMLAKRIDALPTGQTWIFEPKWDGFRTLIFRDGDEILVQSRDAKSLNRYFPELLEPLHHRAEAPQPSFDCLRWGQKRRGRHGAGPPGNGGGTGIAYGAPRQSSSQ